MTYKVYFGIVLMIFGFIALCVYSPYTWGIILGVVFTPIGLCLLLDGLSKTEEKIKELEKRIGELEEK